MSNKFIGFALFELVKATGDSDVRTARTYDVVTYDKFGRVKKENLKLSEIEREWGKFRRTGDVFGIMVGSDVRILSAEEFETYRSKWLEQAGLGFGFRQAA